jgi:aminoglycoside phosphotransferase (APT) family kinase protein
VEVEDVAALDPREALLGLGFSDISQPERVLGGWDTLLWHFATADGREHSLRVYYLPERREIVWRERAALEACARAGLPAPKVESVGEAAGLPALVLTWCPGQTLLSVIEQRPWAVWHWGKIFGQTQARIHAVAPPPELAADAPDDWLSRVSERDADLVAHLASLRPATTSLIHLDFHPLNLVVDKGTITGILDWTGAAAGDPRADLARTAATLLSAPVPPGPLKPLLNVARGLVLRAWRAGYEELAGPMPDYRPFLAWAGATLLAEAEPVLDRPEVWGTEQDMEKLRRLIDAWAREAGVR